MPICSQAARQLLTIFEESEAHRTLKFAKRIDSLESKWSRKLESLYDTLTMELVESLGETQRVTQGYVTERLEEFFTEHAFAVMFEAVRSAERLPNISLARYPAGPKSLKGLMKLWDEWRKKGKVPPRQKEIAAKVKAAYLEKVQESWKKHSADYREGTSADKKAIAKQIQKEATAPIARSQTIVSTETTRYYNQVRRDVYDQSNDVTHYLFMAIRDSRTTEWCKTRHGLVYAKDDPELELGPPMHWNCRSEILPLTKQNPRHKALIEDKTKARRNHSPKPLPRGWGSS